MAERENNNLIDKSECLFYDVTLFCKLHPVIYMRKKVSAQRWEIINSTSRNNCRMCQQISLLIRNQREYKSSYHL
jgi:hypothetical protein